MNKIDILVKDSFEVDRYPDFYIDLKGNTIIGYYEDDEKFAIKLKDKVSFQHDKNDPNSIEKDVLAEWNNEVYWYKNYYSEEIEDVKEELGIKSFNKQYKENNDYKELVKILDFEFNYKLDFASQEPKEVIDYVKKFLEGKTEYDISNLFPKDKVLFLIKKLDKEREVA